MTYHRNTFPNLPVWVPMSFHPKKGWYTHLIVPSRPLRARTFEQDYIQYQTETGLDPPTKRVWWYTLLGTATAATAYFFFRRL